MPITVEIKAHCKNQDRVREILLAHNAEFKGTDRQIDTYFHAKLGRLKLREGKIENNLIHYFREDKKTSRESKVSLYKTDPESSLKEILEKSMGTRCVVDKEREIYFIDNVKFHIDNVNGLGKFVEIEAIDTDGSIAKDKLQEQCNYYIKLLEINAKDLISQSYSDLLQQNSLFNQILADE
ncbi:class IV adenylate cyclase [Marinifilum caeruleilacunae]|uniref:CYTH domain-containing protein n=1 Tax=Marinifilum caeruleilacunae TaxID=2499076 RepID=A0ABX1WTZ5_9BACT|nr:class IV adenylate cyclase [Marinifilum caeruleilacunae]NOU59393.1 CYTH domain-containing protein [Marinifilum caeruleilacunae]